MNKKDLCRKVAKKQGKTIKEIEIVVDTFIDTIKSELADGNNVNIKNFLIFKVVDVEEKVNNLNGEIIPAHKTVKIKKSVNF